MASEKPKKNPGGRPRKNQPVGNLTFPRKPARIKVAMSDRKAVERLCEKQIEDLQNEFRVLLGSAKFMVEVQQSIIKEQVKRLGAVSPVEMQLLADYQNHERQILKDQTQVLSMLLKQYELFSALDRPAEDDPLFTPVVLNVHSQPPPEAVVENKFELDPDDIQPGSAESGQLA